MKTIASIDAYITSMCKNNKEFKEDYEQVMDVVNGDSSNGSFKSMVYRLHKSIHDQIEITLKTLGYTTKSYGIYGELYDLEISWRFV